MADITCATCKTTFPEMTGFEGTEQALRCSADVTGDEVVGNYGSTVLDGCLAIFPAGRPAAVHEGIICDACISARLKDGTLEIAIADGSRSGLESEEILEALMAED